MRRLRALPLRTMRATFRSEYRLHRALHRSSERRKSARRSDSFDHTSTSLEKSPLFAFRSDRPRHADEWPKSAESGPTARLAEVQNAHLPAIRLTASVAIPQVQQQSEGRAVFSLEFREDRPSRRRVIRAHSGRNRQLLRPAELRWDASLKRIPVRRQNFRPAPASGGPALLPTATDPRVITWKTWRPRQVRWNRWAMASKPGVTRGLCHAIRASCGPS